MKLKSKPKSLLGLRLPEEKIASLYAISKERGITPAQFLESAYYVSEEKGERFSGLSGLRRG
jgi:hypothetical protein